MKRITILIVAALALVSCKKDNNEIELTFEEQIRQNIVGKWKSVAEDKEEDLTNLRTIMTFSADGTLEVSRSSLDGKSQWMSHFPTTYTVSDSTITYAKSVNSRVIAISASEMQLLTSDPHQVWKFVKVSNDFSKAILGTWEGVELTGYETYGDQKHRWEYKPDGTYVYYKLDMSGDWIPSTDVMSEFTVDGDWLATRWMDTDSVEYREWWDIDRCDSDEMLWSALRDRNDSSAKRDSLGRPEPDVFRATFRMKRVK